MEACVLYWNDNERMVHLQWHGSTHRLVACRCLGAAAYRKHVPKYGQNPKNTLPRPPTPTHHTLAAAALLSDLLAEEGASERSLRESACRSS